MKITILGNNSALPAYGRNPTAQVVEIYNEIFLIDCGEGTQMRMQQYGIKGQRVNHIFISHAHGDHYFGLPGYISSMSLLGRTKKLSIYCDYLIKQIIELQLPWDLGFEIEYRIFTENEAHALISNDKYEVYCFPVSHSIPTFGFRFTEKKRKRILIPKKLIEFQIPKYFYKNLTDGHDYTDKKGLCVKNELVTEPGHPSKVYIYTADTRYDRNLYRFICNADLLYHETTYLQADYQKALERFHSTTHEAAQIALDTHCRKLIIGHFSSKYKDLNPFLEEAKEIFEHTELALEGLCFEI